MAPSSLASGVRMMRGETVIVEDRIEVGRNRYEELVYEYSSVEVRNVLVAPGRTKDVAESNRDGDLIAYTLYFPKSFAGSLDGRRVSVRGEWCRVVGAPRPYDPAASPTDWNMVVEVATVDG